MQTNTTDPLAYSVLDFEYENKAVERPHCKSDEERHKAIGHMRKLVSSSLVACKARVMANLQDKPQDEKLKERWEWTRDPRVNSLKEPGRAKKQQPQPSDVPQYSPFILLVLRPFCVGTDGGVTC
jgi:hypothetical protein